MTMKIKQQINNIVGDNVKALEQLFPSVVKDGQVDFEALKEELGQFEEVGSEKYELTWSGKQSAKKLAQEDVINRTLKYIEEDSKNSETTENLYIEGDNLEVLKLLRQNYYGSIKMIYIDPPYNTGNDFVYNDKFSMDKKSSDEAEGVTDEEGNPLQRNQQSSNRYHANWLNMMYPRLKLAKDLLIDDGVIFISIDENELENLKSICSEIFGEENYVQEIIWEKKFSPQNDAKYFSLNHESILCYAKNKSKFSRKLLPMTEEQVSRYKNPDNDIRGDWMSSDLTVARLSHKDRYPITTPKGKEVRPTAGRSWGISETTFNTLTQDNRIWFGKNGDGFPRLKRFLGEVNQGKVPISIWYNAEVGHTQQASQELKQIFDNKYFDYPKPVNLIERCVYLSVDNNDIILDFFSGSATTAHAVMQLNAEDGGNRKFICVQLPEATDEKSEAYKAGYKNICEIGKERIRRAGDKIVADNQDKEGIDKLDIGFKVFRTADTNIKWNVQDTLGQANIEDMEFTPDLLDFVSNTKDIDVLYEILLRQRDISLADTLEILTDIGERTYLYASSFLICLETEITEDLVENLAKLSPLPTKFVFRDSAFKDDINLKDYTFRNLKSLIASNSGDTKQTYTVEFI